MARESEQKFDHVVSVMFENRTFHNLLGRLYEPGEVASFEGVLGKELTNPIPDWAEHGADRARCGTSLLYRPASGVPRCLGLRGEEAVRMSARNWRQLLPPITPRLVLRALLGVLLLFVGIGLGIWLVPFAKGYEKKFAQRLTA